MLSDKVIHKIVIKIIIMDIPSHSAVTGDCKNLHAAK